MIFDSLVDFLDGREFENRQEFEQAVNWWADDTIEQVGRVERWVKERANLDELNIKIKE